MPRRPVTAAGRFQQGEATLAATLSRPLAPAPTLAPARGPHPLHAILLAFPLPLFLGALLADYAYWRDFHIQWANFASWLIAGALLVGGIAALWALVDLARFRTRRAALHAALIGGMWLLGLVNAFIHAKDAFATMPEGLILSAVVTLLALAASWTGFSPGRDTA